MTSTAEVTLEGAAIEMDHANDRYRDATFALTRAQEALSIAEAKEFDARMECERASLTLVRASLSRPGWTDPTFWETHGESERGK